MREKKRSQGRDRKGQSAIGGEERSAYVKVAYEVTRKVTVPLWLAVKTSLNCVTPPEVSIVLAICWHSALTPHAMAKRRALSRKADWKELTEELVPHLQLVIVLSSLASGNPGASVLDS